MRLFLLFFCGLALFGQSSQTWVSGVGDDANPCSRTAPCLTFSGALSKTAAGGKIDALDPGDFGSVTITKAITISATAKPAMITAISGSAITVNAGAGDTVTLRGLRLTGKGTGTSGVVFTGGGVLELVDCEITQFTTAALELNAGSQSKASILDSNFHNNTTGVQQTTSADVFIRNLVIDSGTNGLVWTTGPVKVEDSSFTSLTGSALNALAGARPYLLNSQFSQNNVALQADAGASILLSNNEFAYNTTGIDCETGIFLSYSNNRFTDNGATCAPTAVPNPDTVIPTTTVFTAAPSTSVYGQSVTFTVAVTGNAAPVTSGTVTFVDASDGNAVLASNVALNGTGIAGFSTSLLGAGSHTIQATYSGAFLPSSNTATIVVSKAALTVTATVGAASMTYGGTAPATGLSITGFVNNENSGSNGALTIAPDVSISIGGAVTGQGILTITNSVPAVVTALSATTPAGSYTLTSGSETGGNALTAANYTFSYSPAAFTVNKAALTVTPTVSAPSMIYGGSAPTTGISITGFVNNENNGTNSALTAVSGASISIGGALTGQALLTITNSVPAVVASLTSATPADSYTLTTSSAAGGNALTAANYTIGFATAPFTVNKAVLTLTATVSAGSMTYGGTAPTTGISVTGFVNNDNNGTNNALSATPGASISIGGAVTGAALLTITNSVPAVVASLSSSTPAGAYTLTPSAATGANALTAANYSFNVVTAPFTVNKAALTATATVSAPSMTYGGTAPTTGISITGFVNNDNNGTNNALSAASGVSISIGGALTGQALLTITNSVPAVTGPLTSATPAGSYTLTPSSGTGGNALTAANYTIGFVTAPFTVNKAALTVTATVSAASMTIGGTAPTTGISVTGFVNNDNNGTNAALAVTPGASVSIGGALTGQALLTITNSVPAVVPSITPATPVGSYTLTPSSAAGGSALAAANYTLSYAPASFTVNKAVLTVTVNPVNLIYGSAIPTLSATITGYQNGDTSAVVTGAPALSTAATAGSFPGSYPINIAIGTLAAANYTFALVPGQVSIGTLGSSLSITATAGPLGTSVVITFNVQPDANGTVSFTLDGGQSQTVQLNGGTAVVALASRLALGTHTINADYSGDGIYSGSSATFQLTVAQATPTATVSSGFPANTVPASQAFAVTAKIAGPTGAPVPGGTVTWTLDGGAAQNVTLVSGVATLPIQSLTAGTHSVAVTYNGDASYVSSATSTLSMTATGTTPVVPEGGLVSGALTTSNISPGAWASIFGGNLSTTTTQVPALPLPKLLNGVTVTINGTACPLNYVSPTQINFQVPYETALGSATVVVSTSAGTGSPFTVTVTAAAPAIFTYVNSSGVVDPVIVHGTTFALVSSSAPAQAGETLVIYATGAGPVNNTPASGDGAGAGGTSIVNPTVKVGDATATVAFSGLTQGLVGLYQINIVLPTTLPAGKGTPPTLPVVISLPDNSSPPVNLYVSK